eukprot:scaffold149_cov315-Pinguiococcus_pyrenoidosus.AAC.115
MVASRQQRFSNPINNILDRLVLNGRGRGGGGRKGKMGIRHGAQSSCDCTRAVSSPQEHRCQHHRKLAASLEG